MLEPYRQSLYLPPKGAISRKRRIKWRKQILKNHPGLNPEWLDANYEIHWCFQPSFLLTNV